MSRSVPVVLWLLLMAAPAAAQTPTDVISFLVTNQSVQTGDFSKDRAAAAATRDTIARSLLVNLATVPIESASSGFVYRLDPELGTESRVSDSFGTFFVERAMTSGRGRASFGASGTTTGYDRLDGFNLRDGSFTTTANQFRDEAAPFDVESLTLKIRASTMTFFGSYGVTDRLEIGGALPLVQLNIEGARLNVYRGDSFVQASATASASGLADAAVRAKYLLYSTRTAGVAAAAEVRLPTGDAQDLLGAGRAALRIMGVGSVESGRVGAHGNLGIVRGGVSNEFDGSGALTFAATPHVTLVGELLIRHLSDVRQIVAVTAAHPTIAGVDTLRLLPGTSATTLSTGVTGVKWNVAATMVLTAELRWRVGNAGLTAPFTPTVAFDYLF
jgi:outer membrane putative beta-barrel porin/alpha-amylase